MSDWGHIEIPDLSGVGRLIRDATEAAYQDAAERVPERICDHLRSGRKPDGTAQPQNTQATIDAKGRKGQGSTPGVADGVMSDPGRWRVVHRPGRSTVHPPAEREDVIDYLDPHDYEFVGVPEEFDRDLEDALERRLAKVT